MKIIGFAGSNSKNSINKALVTYALSLFGDKHNTELLDLNDYQLPTYGIDLEKENGIHENALAFAKKLSSADLILVSMAEHNGNYTAAFKSMYDWVSRIKDRNKVFDGKKVFILSTSPGGRGAQSSLSIAKDRFPRDAAEVVGTFSLPNFNDTFSRDDGKIIDEVKNEELLTIIDKLNGLG